MPNLIELANAYVPMLDEVYRLASCTSDLDAARLHICRKYLCRPVNLLYTGVQP